MSNSDFETLVHLCLESDSILIDGKGFKQQSGLAMGNNLAPVLAIIYMNEIDQQITTKTNGLVILKRYTLMIILHLYYRDKYLETDS